MFSKRANYKPELGEDVKDLTSEQAIENANVQAKQNGRLARYYNGILYITEPDTDIVVTMMKRKKLKGFKPL